MAVVLSSLVLCAAGSTLLSGSIGCTGPLATADRTAPAGGRRAAVGSYTPDQVALAATIVTEGARMGVPERGWVIAVATAIQESGLSNPAGGDLDSVGLFQQRPSQGWGTPSQLRDPAYASRTFYAKQLTIANWQQMSLTAAAQAVQISA